jgi:nucleotide-binding universal stress UspA family protein
MFRNLLVPIDGSPDAERALAEAADLAGLANGAMTVMTVIPDSSTWVLGGGHGAFIAPQSVRDLDQQVENDTSACSLAPSTRCRRISR